jgi:hypothetical protein
MNTDTDIKDEVGYLLAPQISLNQAGIWPAILKLKGAGFRDGERADRFGVLVAGEFVLAANLELLTTDGPHSEMHPFVPVEASARDGRTFELDVIEHNIVSGLTVLGALDYERFPDQGELFSQFCESTKPISLDCREFENIGKEITGLAVHQDRISESLKIGLSRLGSPYFFTHEFSNYAGEGRDARTVEEMNAKCDAAFDAPVLSSEGALLGFVTHGSFIARPHRVLPRYLVERIMEAQEEGIQNT